MSVSKVLYYRKIQFESLTWEYVLAEQEGKLFFFGREKKNGLLRDSVCLHFLPYSENVLCFFLDQCAESQTAPRMIEELMVENLVPGFSLDISGGETYNNNRKKR
ncbi:MAG: hypothetical protein IKJ74_07520 [Clostridia bacterium]|nr:hypothetical protein [Clostridia bacterium]